MRWVLALLCAVTLRGQTSAPPTGGVNGRVTNSVTGDLVPGATVRLIPLHNTAPDTPPLQTNSQADGSFHLDSVPAGSYAATAEKDGFVSNQLDTRSSITSVQAGQTVTDVTVQLTPQGSISGKVVDADGKPVQGVDVRVLSAQKSGSSAASAEDGAFKILKLPPGEYYVCADPPKELPGGYVRTIFPHSLNLDGASTIQVAAGQSTEDVNVRMVQAATYHIRGKVSDPPDGAPTQKFRVTVLPKASIDASALERSVAVNPDRTFDIAGLVPGNYTLRLTGQLNWTGRANRVLARQDVEVGTASLEGILLQITPPLVIAGHVTVDSQLPFNFNRVWLTAVPVEETARTTRVHGQVASDGSFSLSNLDPGLYQFQVMTNVTGFYIKSVLFNQQDIINRDVDLSQTGGGQIEVIVRSGTAEVDVTVQPADAAAQVILVPEFVGLNGFGLRYEFRRQAGIFSLTGVPPGRYTAYAADSSTGGLFANPDFLRNVANLGARIQVDENSRQQVELQKLPLEQLRQIAGSLGIPVQ